MKYRVHTADDLGLLLRAVRKQNNVRQDDFAATVGVSKQFASDVEKRQTHSADRAGPQAAAASGRGPERRYPDAAIDEFNKLKAIRAKRANGGAKDA